MMQINDPEYMKKVCVCWEKHILNDETMPLSPQGPRPEVWESWMRSKSYQISPTIPENTQLTPFEFQERLRQSCDLLKSADSYFFSFSQFLKGTHALIQISDQTGCILKTMMQDDLIMGMSHNASDINRGLLFDEESSGTNSMSLCLQSRTPVQIFGEEHYLQRDHPFAGLSSPIFCDNELIGVLTAIIPKNLYRPHLLGMVTMAARGIENVMKIDRASMYIEAKNTTIETLLKSSKSGVIILDADYRVVRFNKKALQCLDLNTAKNIKGERIYALLKKNSLPPKIRRLDKDIPASDVDVLTADGKSVNITLQVDQTKNQMQKAENIILSITPQTRKDNLSASHASRNGFEAAYTFDSIIGNSKKICDLKSFSKKAAHSMSNVLILGESGVGKELFAQAIHNASNRRNGPFVAVNCGSIPRDLMESELFGYEGGSFTGAKSNGNPGKFELADGGTLFLDEIGDMSLELQTALLRVIQEKEIMRIGSTHKRRIDTRIITATNMNLAEAVSAKRFRMDLYFRLDVLTVQIPPLRQRREDIIPLIRHFLDIYAKQNGKSNIKVDPAALEHFVLYDWPGNVRELENVIERILNQIPGNLITDSDLPTKLRCAKGEPLSPVSAEKSNELSVLRQKDAPISPEIYEHTEILRLLEEENGHVKSVALRMGMPLSTLYRKLYKYNLNPKEYRKWE